MKIFSQRLKELRKDAGLSQVALAKDSILTNQPSQNMKQLQFRLALKFLFYLQNFFMFQLTICWGLKNKKI